MFNKIKDHTKYEGGSKEARLEIDYKTLKEKLGEPFYNHLKNFPDDQYKVRVCWGFESDFLHKEGGDGEYKDIKIAIWDWKNFTGNLEDIKTFSFWISDSFYLDTFLDEYELKSYFVKI